MKGRIYFPTDPGYKDTARMLVESGLTLTLGAELRFYPALSSLLVYRRKYARFSTHVSRRECLAPPRPRHHLNCGPLAPPASPLSYLQLLCSRSITQQGHPQDLGLSCMDYPTRCDPNYLGLRCNGLPAHQMALITSGCVQDFGWRDMDPR